ncbi:MAG: CarD family transcriptional regulator [Ruminococcus flavefaciens]|nr:CarD family transcriptional regulator [Ruminococcus flavefaciens]
MCGNKGVCVVENITTLDILGVDKERQYYILKPKYQAGSTVYVPVDASGESMRRVLKKEEAERLIASIPEIPPLVITNEKLSEQTYRDCLRSGSCEEWVRVLKTIYVRKQKRLQAGRKITAVDAKYSRMAEESLYGELAVVLEINRSDMERYLAGELSGKM